MPCNPIAYFYYIVVTRLTVPLDREMGGCFFHDFLTLEENFVLQTCNIVTFFSHFVKLDLPHSVIPKSRKVITKHCSANQLEMKKESISSIPCADSTSGRSKGSYESSLGSGSMRPLFKLPRQCMVPVHGLNSLDTCSQTSDYFHMIP